MRAMLRVLWVMSVAAIVLGPGRRPVGDWADRFRAWHSANEFRCYGGANSANLAWWESYLLQSYLPMYAVTGDAHWLDRFVAHTDTMFGLMRDAPGSGAYWPGYRDGFLGWGTTRYDPQGRYQEYMVHDGRICLPVARFIRLVFEKPDSYGRYERRAQSYLATIEQNVIAKWYRNWSVDRGSGEDLESFGGWRRLPVNQSLVFGELLMVLADIAKSPLYRRSWSELPDGFYAQAGDSMAALFKRGLLYHSADDAYVWRYMPQGSGGQRWEDLSHGDLDVSFALEAYRQGRVFTRQDMARFAHCLARTIWNGSPERPEFARFVDGSGGPDSTANLRDWLRLTEFDPEVGRAVEQAYEVNPDWSSPARAGVQMALTMAQLAEMEAASPAHARFHWSRESRRRLVPTGDSALVPLGPSAR